MEKITLTVLWEQATQARNNGQTTAARQLYHQILQQEEDPRRRAEAWQMIGVCHKIDNNLEAALESLAKAFNDYQEAGDLLGQGNVARDIALTYAYQERYKEALPWLEKSIAALEQTDDRSALGMSRVKKGLVLARAEQRNTEALPLAKKGLEEIRADKEHYNWFFEMTALFNIAEILFLQDNPSFLTYAQAALALIYEAQAASEQKRRLAQIYILLAHGYQQNGNQGQALKFLQRGESLLQELEDPEARKVIARELDLDQLKERIKSS